MSLALVLCKSMLLGQFAAVTIWNYDSLKIVIVYQVLCFQKCVLIQTKDII